MNGRSGALIAFNSLFLNWCQGLWITKIRHFSPVGLCLYLLKKVYVGNGFSACLKMHLITGIMAENSTQFGLVANIRKRGHNSVWCPTFGIVAWNSAAWQIFNRVCKNGHGDKNSTWWPKLGRVVRIRNSVQNSALGPKFSRGTKIQQRDQNSAERKFRV